MYFGDYPTARKQRSRIAKCPSVSCVYWVMLHVRNSYLSAPENSWCCYLFKKKIRLFKQQRLSAARYTLPVHNPLKKWKSEFDHILMTFTFTNNVQNKQFGIRRSHFCRATFLIWRVFSADVKMFVSFTFAIQKSTNKKPKQNSLPIILSSCFHLRRSGTLVHSCMHFTANIYINKSTKSQRLNLYQYFKTLNSLLGMWPKSTH